MTTAVHPMTFYENANHNTGGATKWGFYLALSLIGNLYLMSVLPAPWHNARLPEVRSIKVNLMALAAPAPQPVETVRDVQPVPVPVKDIVTQKQAEEAIAPDPVKAPPEPAPAPASKPESVVKTTPERKAAQAPAPIQPQPSRDQGQDQSTVIHEAQYRKQIAPVYPPRALDRGHQGTVTLHAEITPDGLPRELKVAQSSGHRLLDKAALAAVKRWEFVPTQVDGRIVTSWVRVPVRFSIQ